MRAKVTVIEVPMPLAAPVAFIEEPLAINGAYEVAFQQGAFQSNAFQMSPVPDVLTASPFPASVTIIEVI